MVLAAGISMLSVLCLPGIVGGGRDVVEVTEDEELDEEELDDVLSVSESDDCSECASRSK